MPPTIPCPSCRAAIRLRPETVGEWEQCDRCGELFEVPVPAEIADDRPKRAKRVAELRTGFRLGDTSTVAPPRSGRGAMYVAVGAAVLLAAVVLAFRFWPGTEVDDGTAFVPPPPVLPPREPADLRSVVQMPTRVMAITPPPILEAVELTLPGSADAAGLGGGGRFVIYRIATAKQLVVLDVSAAKLVKTIPLTTAAAPFAAGMNKLFVYQPDTKSLQRWDLATWEKEFEGPCPVGGEPTALAMGHLTDGPLYVGGVGVGQNTPGYALLRGDTLKELHLEDATEGLNTGANENRTDTQGRPQPAYIPSARLSPDGRLIAWTGGYHRRKPGSQAVASVTDRRLTWLDAMPPPPNFEYAKPPHFGAGDVLFTATGQFRTDLAGVGTNATASAAVPAASGPWKVLAGWRKGDHWPAGGARGYTVAPLHGPETAGAFVPHPPRDQPFAWQMTQDQLALRVQYVPQAEALVAIHDPECRRVSVHRVRTPDVVRAAGRPVLAAGPPPAVRGKPWRYAPTPLPADGKCELAAAGPPGLTVTDGSVTWDVPADAKPGWVPFDLTVRSGAGATTFKLGVRVVEEPPPDATVFNPVAKTAAPPTDWPAKPADPPPLAPTTAADGTAVALPSAADRWCLAGAGRFVLLRLPASKEMAVVDLVRGALVKRLPLPTADTLIAGGRTFAYAVHPDTLAVTRWSLGAFEAGVLAVREAGSAEVVAGRATHLETGHATDGPLFLGVRSPTHKVVEYASLYLVHQDGTRVPVVKLDGAKLRPTAIAVNPRENYASPFAVTADGGRAVTPQEVVAFAGAEMRVAFLGGTDYWHLKVGQDGTVFANVPYPPDRLAGHPFLSGQPAGRNTIPAADGPWHLSTQAVVQTKTGDPLELTAVSLHATGRDGVLADLPKLPGLDWPRPLKPAVKGQPYLDRRPLPIQSRAWLVPQVGAVAAVNDAGTAVAVHRVDVKAAWAVKGGNRCALVGYPPHAVRGRPFAFAPELWANGKWALELADGPPGMTVADGTVRWAVPDGLVEGMLRFTVKATGPAGETQTREYLLPILGPFAD